jgi:hypothetical protein
VSSSPLKGFFNSHLPALQQGSTDFDNALEDGHDDIIITNDRHDEQKARTQRDQEGTLYNELNKTRPIKVDDCYVTLCRHFKYLGSLVSFSLCDDFNIMNRVQWEL